MGMFCYQCEQSFRGTGCVDKGVCGKDAGTAALQDVLLHQVKGLAWLLWELRQKGKTFSQADAFIMDALFVTVTNVNFDKEDIACWIRRAGELKEQAREAYKREFPQQKDFPASVLFAPALSLSELESQGTLLSILHDHPDPDLRSLEHILIYGLKGMAAYAHHASVLGLSDDSIHTFTEEALARVNSRDAAAAELLDLNMRCGKANLRCMEILDEAHTKTFGHPEPTAVSKTLKKGPAIIVTGHDLDDLLELLKQTEGKGVNIYTHGEMLPAHAYPGLKKFPHLAGHFGTAWQNQRKEFDGVPAAFYFTTNCIQEPKTSYYGQVFTGGLVAWPGCVHIENRDFTPLIEKALALGGFAEEIPGGHLTTGFGHNAVAGVSDAVLDAVARGKIRHFFLVGGCDGAKPGRNYYTEFAEKAPEDTVIMTLACGKFRFNSLEFGSVEGIPRLLDIGQCNDAYSAIKIAQTLASALNCGVNDLPLSLILSWYEQKAVAILLTLLSLGIKGIRLGPSLPAFITPNVLKVLVDQFGIKPITSAEADLQEILGAGAVS